MCDICLDKCRHIAARLLDHRMLDRDREINILDIHQSRKAFFFPLYIICCNGADRSGPLRNSFGPSEGFSNLQRPIFDIGSSDIHFLISRQIRKS